MRVVIQRVSEASVVVNNETIGKIEKGLALLIGIGEDDDQKDVDYIVRKVGKMRIFEDEEGKMNLSLNEVGGSILSISQFTLHADTKKGNRPSFVYAAKPEKAIPLYESVNDGLRQEGFNVQTGEFGANMQIALVNDGPVTILVDSKNK